MHPNLTTKKIGDNRLLVTGSCSVLEEESHSVEVDELGFVLWQGGMLIQDAFPAMSPGDREFLQTGISPKGWEQTFGSDDEEDES